MRVRGQALTGGLATEVVELFLGQPAFEERPRVHTGRGVALDVHLIAEAAIALAAEEVIEPDLVERRRRRVRREVATQAVEAVIRAVDHRHGVPAHEGADPPLDVLVAREPRFLFRRDRVDVVGRHHRRNRRALVPGPLHEPGEEVVRARLALDVDHRVQRLEPLRRFLLVDIRQLVDRAVDEHGRAPSLRPPWRRALL